MEATVARAGATARELNGAGIIAAIKASGIEYILSVPDIVTSAGLLAPIAKDKDLRLVRVCKEDECIGIATGLAYSDKRALVLIQHTGFLDSINAIRGVAVEYKQPICMMIGLLQHDPEKTPKESPRYGVRIVEPILDDMGIAHHLLSVDADIAKIKPAIDKAYAELQPVAFLVGQESLSVTMKRDDVFDPRPPYQGRGGGRDLQLRRRLGRGQSAPAQLSVDRRHGIGFIARSRLRAGRLTAASCAVRRRQPF